jgi:hypothetical protein
VTKNYVFSVRSAYHLEWEHQFGAKTRRGDVQGSSQFNPVWEVVWKLRVPSKIQIFLWKSLHGILPGMSILASRHIKVTPQCPICQAGPEYINHLLFKCLRATEVWEELGLTSVINNALMVDRSGSVVLEFILCSPDKKSPNNDQLDLKELICSGMLVYLVAKKRKGEGSAG